MRHGSQLVDLRFQQLPRLHAQVRQRNFWPQIFLNRDNQLKAIADKHIAAGRNRTNRQCNRRIVRKVQLGFQLKAIGIAVFVVADPHTIGYFVFAAAVVPEIIHLLQQCVFQLLQCGCAERRCIFRLVRLDAAGWCAGRNADHGSLLGCIGNDLVIALFIIGAHFMKLHILQTDIAVDVTFITDVIFRAAAGKKLQYNAGVCPNWFSTGSGNFKCNGMPTF